MKELDKKYFEKQSLKSYKDLIGKSLKVVHKGSKTYPYADKPTCVHIDEAYVYYLFDIEKHTSEAYKNIDYLHGKSCVCIEFWGTDFDADKIAMNNSDCVILNYQDKGEFEKEQFYLIDRETGLKKLENYFRNKIMSGIIKPG